MLGVVENMADLKISFSSIGESGSGVRLVNAQGEDLSLTMLQK